MPIIYNSPRDDSSSANDSSSSLTPTIIAGIAVAGAIALGVVLWLSIRQCRIRNKNKRENDRGAAFLSVRGVVKEGEPLPESLQSVKGTFSRDQLTQSVVLPDKVLLRPSAPAEEIIDYHRQSGNFPRPSFSRPFSFALNAGGDAARPSSQAGGNRGSWISFMSSGIHSAHSRYSVMSSSSSVDSTPTSGTVRKIRQLFSPVLPDEMLVNLGDKITVVQSFDDGWCVVGREGSAFSQSKSLFKQQPESESNTEIGVVPAWCFLKPVVGLKAERPIRSTSLGITVQMEGPAFSSREEIISWSNF